MSPNIALVPLEETTNDHLQQLCTILWSWQSCGTCTGKASCTESACAWSRNETIVTTLHRYKRLASSYIPDYFTKHALSCHDDLFQILKHMKAHPDKVKSELMELCFTLNGLQTAARPTVPDQERALNLAASVLLSLSCGIPDTCIDHIDDSDFVLPWAPGMSINTFISEAFPTRQTQGQAIDTDLLKALTAKRLKHKTGLHFAWTDDLRSHLRLDTKIQTVYIFDGTAVLEEMLLASMNDPTWCLLPRGLLMELLYTIYKVLFPPGRESQDLLSSLVRDKGFDKDMLRYTTQLFRRDDDPDVDYCYFGDRLLELYNELEDPSPRNWFERLFEGGSKSAERKMLMATTIGVFIAVTIGLFGLVIAGFQAWVGYQQWKHPVKET